MISSEITQAQLIGNGAATAIPTGIKVYASSQLKVYKGTNTSLGTLLVEGVDYSVSSVAAVDDTGLDNDITAVVTMNSAPAENVYIRVLRETEDTQETSIRAAKAFDPTVLEVTLDKIVMRQQEFATALAGALKLFGVTSDFFVPTPNGVLGFNADSELSIVSGALPEASVAAWLQPLLLSASSSVFLAALGASGANAPRTITDWYDVPNYDEIFFYGAAGASNAPNASEAYVGIWAAQNEYNGVLFLFSLTTRALRMKSRFGGAWDSVYTRFPLHLTPGGPGLNTLSQGAGTYHGVVTQAATDAPTTDALGNALGNYNAAYLSTSATGYGRAQLLTILNGSFAGYVFQRSYDEISNKPWKQMYPVPSQQALFAYRLATNTAPAAISTTLAISVLNTSVYNNIPGVSLNSSKVTLPAGTYEIEAEALTANNFGRLVLWNETDSSNLAISMNAGDSTADTSPIRLRHYLVLSATKEISLHTIHASGANRGRPTNLGGLQEQYSYLHIKKLDW